MTKLNWSKTAITRVSLQAGPDELARERLRKRYRPNRVRLLFVGESPPASGRFFYQADSGLYRAVREAFVKVFPAVAEPDFLASFRDLGCYLVDLCGAPVDRMARRQRQQICRDSEVRLSRLIKDFQPEAVITVVRSIALNVTRAQQLARWSGSHLVLPYPGRWHHHRIAFLRTLSPVLAEILVRSSDGVAPGVRGRAFSAD